MSKSLGKKLLEKVDEVLDQVRDTLTKNRNQLQPIPIKVKSRN